MASAFGAKTRVCAVAATRPTASAGASRWTAVMVATRTHGIPRPITALAARAVASYGSARTPTATANSARPAAASTRSGTRRSRGPVSRPARTEPTPWTAYSTPAYAGERPSPLSTTA